MNTLKKFKSRARSANTLTSDDYKSLIQRTSKINKNYTALYKYYMKLNAADKLTSLIKNILLTKKHDSFLNALALGISKNNEDNIGVHYACMRLPPDLEYMKLPSLIADNIEANSYGTCFSDITFNRMVENDPDTLLKMFTNLNIDIYTFVIVCYLIEDIAKNFELKSFDSVPAEFVTKAIENHPQKDDIKLLLLLSKFQQYRLGQGNQPSTLKYTASMLSDFLKANNKSIKHNSANNKSIKHKTSTTRQSGISSTKL